MCSEKECQRDGNRVVQKVVHVKDRENAVKCCTPQKKMIQNLKTVIGLDEFGSQGRQQQ